MRHLRRDRREYAAQERCAGGRNHRQPVRGGRLSEPGNLDQGQHAACPRCCCSAVRTCSFRGLQQAWRHHLARLWSERNVRLPAGVEPADCIKVPDDALYYAALGCIEVGKGEAEDVAVYQGTERLGWWIKEGQHQEKSKEGGRALIRDEVRSRANSAAAMRRGMAMAVRQRDRCAHQASRLAGPLFVGCDFGSTTAKAVVLSPEKELLYTAYVQSKGNPIRTPKRCFATSAPEASSGSPRSLSPATARIS